ncbi:MAG: ABC transporter permease [Trueperaceae bacterium]|nr:ABC transporter permease [Trueperaceae bacterium]
MRFLLAMFKRNRLSAPALLIVLLLFATAVFAPMLATHSPIRQDFRALLQPPSSEHWFGTDELGRDIYSRVVHGARVSVTVAVLAVGFGALAGVLIGLLAGYLGGLTDDVLMRFIDVLLAFPGILLAILIASILGSGMFPVVLAVAIFSVPTFARVMRSSVLSIKNREYVEGARAAGARDLRVIGRHVLVNAFGPVLVYATLLMGAAILTAAALSFLGVGVAPPTPEWGAMISSGRAFMRQAPHVVIFPGIAIFLTVLGFNILGDALRDAFDPRR